MVTSSDGRVSISTQAVLLLALDRVAELSSPSQLQLLAKREPRSAEAIALYDTVRRINNLAGAMRLVVLTMKNPA